MKTHNQIYTNRIWGKQIMLQINWQNNSFRLKGRHSQSASSHSAMEVRCQKYKKVEKKKNHLADKLIKCYLQKTNCTEIDGKVQRQYIES